MSLLDPRTEAHRDRLDQQADSDRREIDDARQLRVGPICIWCEGRGKVERYVQRLRRRALIPCTKCDGTGHRMVS